MSITKSPTILVEYNGGEFGAAVSVVKDSNGNIERYSIIPEIETGFIDFIYKEGVLSVEKYFPEKIKYLVGCVQQALQKDKRFPNQFPPSEPA